MSSNTILARIKEESGKDEFQWLSQNRTFYADQFTEEGPTSDDDRATIAPKSMKEVFEHYKPQKSEVELEDEDGSPIYEDFKFRSINDFEDEQIIANSPHLNNERSKVESYNSIIRHLEKNKPLRNALKDSNAREELKNALKALIAELEESNNF